MKTQTQYAVIRAALAGQRRSIQMGRSRHVAGFWTATPVLVLAGDRAPVLDGRPYLKTGFSNGRGFSLTLYTPSTMQVTVGRAWLDRALGLVPSGETGPFAVPTF